MGPERCTKRGWEEGAPRRVLAWLGLSRAQVAARWGRVLTLALPWVSPPCWGRAGTAALLGLSTWPRIAGVGCGAAATGPGSSPDFFGVCLLLRWWRLRSHRAQGPLRVNIAVWPLVCFFFKSGIKMRSERQLAWPADPS